MFMTLPEVVTGKSANKSAQTLFLLLTQSGATNQCRDQGDQN